MTNYLERFENKALGLRALAIQGIEEFSKNPLKYTSQAVTDLGKEYWDVAAALLAGYAVADTKHETFGDYRTPVAVVSSIASIIGTFANSGKGLSVRELSDVELDKFIRNTLAGFAAGFYGWSNGKDIPDSSVLPNKILALISASASVVMNSKVRRELMANSKSNLRDLPLEHRVD